MSSPDREADRVIPISRLALATMDRATHDDPDAVLKTFIGEDEFEWVIVEKDLVLDGLIIYVWDVQPS